MGSDKNTYWEGRAVYVNYNKERARRVQTAVNRNKM